MKKLILNIWKNRIGADFSFDDSKYSFNQNSIKDKFDKDVFIRFESIKKIGKVTNVSVTFNNVDVNKIKESLENEFPIVVISDRR